MTTMTLNDAIQHLEENIKTKTDWCDDCKQEHIQLLDWLIELREQRKSQTALKKDFAYYLMCNEEAGVVHIPKFEVEKWLKKEKPENVSVVNAKWEYWAGWRSNHDHRIEGATCSLCGYEHPHTVYSPKSLPDTCPACNSVMYKGE